MASHWPKVQIQAGSWWAHLVELGRRSGWPVGLCCVANRPVQCREVFSIYSTDWMHHRKPVWWLLHDIWALRGSMHIQGSEWHRDGYLPLWVWGVVQCGVNLSHWPTWLHRSLHWKSWNKWQSTQCPTLDGQNELWSPGPQRLHMHRLVASLEDYFRIWLGLPQIRKMGRRDQSRRYRCIERHWSLIPINRTYECSQPCGGCSCHHTNHSILK